VLPPVQRGTPYPVFVPTTDVDGNDVAGIRLPEVTVPVATYTGWALLAHDGDEGCDGAGQKIAFARNKADRLQTGDPRLSLEERYPNHDAYVSRVTQAANALRRERLFLDEDVQRAVTLATSSSVGR
jgi:Alpha/beta hydrolase domain